MQQNDGQGITGRSSSRITTAANLIEFRRQQQLQQKTNADVEDPTIDEDDIADILQLESSVELGSDFNDEVMKLLSPSALDCSETFDLRASELSQVMKSFQASPAPDMTPDDDQILADISFEESKDEDDDNVLTDTEWKQFGCLKDLYPLKLLRPFWVANKLDTLFPWQIDCLTKRSVLDLNSK